MLFNLLNNLTYPFTLFFTISKIQLVIFNFNYQGYIESLQPIKLKEDEIVIDDLNVDNTSTALFSFIFLIVIKLLFVPFLWWMLDGNVLTDQSIDNLIHSFSPLILLSRIKSLFSNVNFTIDKFWDYLSFFTFWLIFLWWIFAWTILIFNLLLGVNYLFWYIYVFLIKFFPFF